MLCKMASHLGLWGHGRAVHIMAMGLKHVIEALRFILSLRKGPLR